MINNKLEDSIKSSLENYEIPYDESAWTAMSAKLDKVKPVKEPFLAKPKNWFIISASLVTITSITLFFVLDSNQPTKKSEKKSKTTMMWLKTMPFQLSLLLLMLIVNTSKLNFQIRIIS